METKNNIFKEHIGEYLKANKERKTEILDAICLTTKMHRKSVIRRFRVLQMKDSLSESYAGRPLYYGADVTAALKDIWKQEL